MLKFNNTHIFTGYLKQKLSSENIPTCKIYTREFDNYLAAHGKEDPRVIESIDTVDYRRDPDDNDIRLATRINYLKNNEIYNYFWNYTDYDNKKDLGLGDRFWRPSITAFYDKEKVLPCLTKTLHSPGRCYDTITHEYLGDYLRFLRDYHNVNLMSLYNCFNNNICNNINYELPLGQTKTNFSSQDATYKIYAIPVKLFADYTIAIDSFQGIEMFCGLYNSNLETTGKGEELIKRTYVKVNSPIFKQPFLYDKLNVKYWTLERELHTVQVLASGQGEQLKEKKRINNSTISRWDITNREQDLKLFIKVPTSCKSSIVILEGDYRNFNNAKYAPVTDKTSPSFGHWLYQQNRLITNFTTGEDSSPVNLNDIDFKPISKVQLLELNTGESYPFADKLVEYLSGSAITSIDEISDNIKRAQRVMKQNRNYFRIEGLWEDKIQKIVYDYVMNSGPIEVVDGKLKDRRQGYHPRLGHTSKSTLYDVLGYIDREAEKWYASWQKYDNKATIQDSIQNVDIYEGLYDI